MTRDSPAPTKGDFHCHLVPKSREAAHGSKGMWRKVISTVELLLIREPRDRFDANATIASRGGRGTSSSKLGRIRAPLTRVSRSLWTKRVLGQPGPEMRQFERQSTVVTPLERVSWSPSSGRTIASFSRQFVGLCNAQRESRVLSHAAFS